MSILLSKNIIDFYICERKKSEHFKEIPFFLSKNIWIHANFLLINWRGPFLLPVHSSTYGTL